MSPTTFSPAQGMTHLPYRLIGETLKSELESFRTEFMSKVPPEVREAMSRADLELAGSGIVENALKAGDQAPDFALPDAHGRTVRLSSLLKKGRVVLSFYRGGWCPYCNLELRALQQVLPELRQLNASLIAVSPQLPDASLSTAEKNALEFPVLSDTRSEVARAFGVAFDLAEELRPIYMRFGHALPDVNGDAQWLLPIPATYVIEQNGTIALAFIDVDYRKRLEPADILATLNALSRKHAA
jgi:peroxiredoxin